MIAAQKPVQRKKLKYNGQPAIVIAMGSPKGGPGKSTVGVALAAALGRRAEGPVTVVDLDITANAFKHIAQGVGSDTAFPAKALHLVSLSDKPRALAAQLSELKRTSQFLILDTPGAIENGGAQFALSSADLVIVPTRPSPYDLEATVQGLEILEPIAAMNPTQIQVVVRNAPERTALSRAVNDQLEKYCEETGTYLAKTIIRKSVSFGESAARAMPLWHLGSSAKGPTEDIEALVDELLQILGGK